MSNFKIGDIVKKKNGESFINGEKTATITEWPKDNFFYPVKNAYSLSCGTWVFDTSIELVEEEKVEYEDQWYLNDGKTQIPDDADKLEKDGSVVAFRKRKEKDLEFGDILIGVVTDTEYRFITYDGDSKIFLTVLNNKNKIVVGQKLGVHLKRK